MRVDRDQHFPAPADGTTGESIIDIAWRRIQAKGNHRPAAASVGHRPVVVAIEDHRALALEDARLGSGVIGQFTRITIEMIFRNVEHRSSVGIQVMRRFKLEAGEFDHPDLWQRLARLRGIQCIHQCVERRRRDVAAGDGRHAGAV